MLRKILFVSALLLATNLYAQTATLTVTGTTAVPVCTFILGSGGVADFGTLTAAAVQAWQVAPSPSRYVSSVAMAKTLTLSVDCPTPAKVAISFIDNKAATASPSASSSIVSFGLGIYTPAGRAATNIGRYYLAYGNLTVRATPTDTAVAPAMKLLTTGVATASSTWHMAVGEEDRYVIPGRPVGFGLAATALTPDSLSTISGDLIVYFEPLTEVVNSATTVINLDGSATATLMFL